MGEDSYARAKEFILRRELSVEERIEESEKHLDFDYNGIGIELHCYAAILFRRGCNSSFQQWSRQALLQSDSTLMIDSSGQSIRLPEPTFNAFFVFYHLYHHLLHGGVGLRQLSDWATLLYTTYSRIDRDELERRITEYRLKTAWQSIGYIVVNYLGLPPDKMPLYTDAFAKSAPAILERILVDGNFGQYRESFSARPANFWAGKLYALKHHIIRYTSCIINLPFKADVWHSFWHTIYVGIRALFRG